MKKTFFRLIALSLLLTPFSPAFAQSINVSNSTDGVKQELISLLTELLTKLEIQLQDLLKKSPILLSKPASNPTASTITATTTNQVSQNGIISGTLSAERVFLAVKPTDLFITSISKFDVAPGDLLIIKGHGFLSQSTIHIGSNSSAVVSVQDGSINLKVPNLSNGTYPVWIENTNGSSQNISPQYINISSNSLSRPVITNSYPQIVSQNSTITIEGSGFDQNNNIINSTLGTINNVSAVNGKLQFKVSNFSGAKGINNSSFPDGMKVTYSVNTSKGQTANFGFFVFSSAVAKNNQTIFEKIFSAVDNFFIPKKALAFGRMYDGGYSDTRGIDTECTCTGGTLLKYASALDPSVKRQKTPSDKIIASVRNIFGNLIGTLPAYAQSAGMEHYYVDMPGTSMLVGPMEGTGNLEEDDSYMTTLYPFGICMIVQGEDCDTSDNTPEGTLNIAGANNV